MSSRYRAASTVLGAALALVLLGQGILRYRDFAETTAWLKAEVCGNLKGRSVHIADELLAAHPVCEIAPSKWMYPMFVFEPHFVRLAESRGPRELENFDVVVISPENSFASVVHEVRHEGVLELSPPGR